MTGVTSGCHHFRGGLKKIILRMKKVVKQYCLHTSFHGFRYIGIEPSNFIDRLFWITVCSLGMVITCVMSHSAYTRLRGMPTVTSIESIYYPLGTLPFPGVTICNTNRMYRDGVERLLKEFEPSGWNKTFLIRFFDRLEYLYEEKKFDYEEFEEVTRFMEKIGYDSGRLMLEMSQPCAKLLKSCYWIGMQYNCSRMFVVIRTPKGFCCAFNWHADRASQDSDPDEVFGDVLYISHAGSPNYGLSVTLNLEDSKFYHPSFSSSILFHDGTDYPEFSVQEAFIETGFRTVVRVEGSIIESTENVRQLAPKLRNCLFDDERSLESSEDYSMQTCLVEAKIKRYMDTCNCTPFYYPNILRGRTCNLLDIKCQRAESEKRQKQILKGSVRRLSCMPQCSDKFYHFNTVSSEWKFINRTRRRYSQLEVYFQEVFCVKYRKESILTWDGLLSSLGGIFGLCLGGSILSIIEFAHYFLYQVWFQKEGSSANKPKTQPPPPLRMRKPELPDLFRLEYRNVISRTNPPIMVQGFDHFYT